MKKMSMTSTNGINPSKKIKQIEFYTSFIKAIEKNSEKVINKKNCIEKIEKIKEDILSSDKEKPSLKFSNLNQKENKLYHTKDKVLQFINEQKEEEQKEM